MSWHVLVASHELMCSSSIFLKSNGDGLLESHPGQLMVPCVLRRLLVMGLILSCSVTSKPECLHATVGYKAWGEGGHHFSTFSFTFGWFYFMSWREAPVEHIYNHYPLHLNKSFNYATEMGSDKWAVLGKYCTLMQRRRKRRPRG